MTQSTTTTAATARESLQVETTIRTRTTDRPTTAKVTIRKAIEELPGEATTREMKRTTRPRSRQPEVGPREAAEEEAIKAKGTDGR